MTPPGECHIPCRRHGPTSVPLKPIDHRIDGVVFQEYGQLSLVPVDPVIAWETVEPLKPQQVGSDLRSNLPGMRYGEGVRKRAGSLCSCSS